MGDNIMGDYTIKTTINEDNICQEITHHTLDGFVDTVSKIVADTQEEQFVLALIKLGWKPPRKESV